MTTEEPKPLAKTNAVAPQPDVFAQMPLTQTTKVERLRYMTEPLPHDVLVAGPISLTLYAAIDTTDTNWIIILKDVGADVSVRTAREGERDVPSDLKERELWCSGKRYTSEFDSWRQEYPVPAVRPRRFPAGD